MKTPFNGYTKPQYAGGKGRPLTISVSTAIPSRSAPHAMREEQITFDDLIEKYLKTHIRTAESMQEYEKLDKDSRTACKDIGGFVGGKMKDNYRNNNYLIFRSILNIDIDEPKTPDFVKNFIEKNPYDSYLYSTHSATETSPKCRVIIPLTRDVLPDEFVAVGKFFINDFFNGINDVDGASFVKTQLMFWPSCPKDAKPFTKRLNQGGPWLNPDDILAKHPGWTPETLPQTDDDKTRNTLIGNEESADEAPTDDIDELCSRHTGIRQADPITKQPGFIGDFCRAYTIDECIQRFFSERYKKGTQRGRYTYIPGSTTNGVVIYPSESRKSAFFYSNHGTDPLGHKLLNAYDLVRLGVFGGSASMMFDAFKTDDAVTAQRQSAKDESMKHEDIQSFDKEISSLGACDSLIERLQARQGDITYSTGFPSIDEVLGGGLMPKRLLTLGGTSGAGKSNLCLNIIANLIKQGHDVLYISLELPASEVITKLLSLFTYVDSLDNKGAYPKKPIELTSNKLLQHMTPGEQTYLVGMLNKLKVSLLPHLFIKDTIQELTTDGVRVIVDDFIRLHDGRKPVLFVDYLQRLEPVDPKMAEYLALKKSVYALKDIADSRDLPVIVCSTLNRDSGREEAREDSFSGSSYIEYGSDVLLCLQPEELSKMSKNYRGKADTVEFNKLKFMKERRLVLSLLKNRQCGFRTENPPTLVSVPEYIFFKDDSQEGKSIPDVPKKKTAEDLKQEALDILGKAFNFESNSDTFLRLGWISHQSLYNAFLNDETLPWGEKSEREKKAEAKNFLSSGAFIRLCEGHDVEVSPERIESRRNYKLVSPLALTYFSKYDRYTLENNDAPEDFVPLAIQVFKNHPDLISKDNLIGHAIPQAKRSILAQHGVEAYGLAHGFFTETVGRDIQIVEGTALADQLFSEEE